MIYLPFLNFLIALSSVDTCPLSFRISIGVLHLLHINSALSCAQPESKVWQSVLGQYGLCDLSQKTPKRGYNFVLNL